MAAARIEQGWLRIPYDGPELTLIEIGVAGAWYPAYLDWDGGGHRVAQIRVPDAAGRVPVLIRAAGVTADAGTLTLDGA